MTKDIVDLVRPNEDRLQLIEFWKTVPAIKIFRLQEEIWNNLINQEVRSAILDILREGIEEEPSTEGENVQQRNALSAQELRKWINEQFKIKTKIANIYFHLKILQEAGLIQAVTTLFEGKHHATYFGRTAKLFICRDPELDWQKGPQFKNLVDLITHFNPGQKKEETTEFVKKFFEKYENSDKTIIEWIEKHEELLTTMVIDIRNFHKLFKHFFLDLKVIEEMASLLKIPIE